MNEEKVWKRVHKVYEKYKKTNDDIYEMESHFIQSLLYIIFIQIGRDSPINPQTEFEIMNTNEYPPFDLLKSLYINEL